MFNRPSQAHEQQEPERNGFQSQAPSISLPKSGGAIRGIGEKFAANPVTGTGSMSVPILTSPGRAGFGPQLSLSYDSGSGNGPFGFGWHLSVPEITRKTDKGLPQYHDAVESDDKLAPCGRTFFSATCLTLRSPHTYNPVSASCVIGVSPSPPAPAPGGSLRHGPYRPRLMACNSS